MYLWFSGWIIFSLKSQWLPGLQLHSPVCAPGKVSFNPPAPSLGLFAVLPRDLPGSFLGISQVPFPLEALSLLCHILHLEPFCRLYMFSSFQAKTTLALAGTSWQPLFFSAASTHSLSTLIQWAEREWNGCIIIPLFS